METMELIKHWVLFNVFAGIMSASIPMLWTGKLPIINKKANPIFATALFVIGMTGFLVYATPELLQVTIDKITG